ncbi:MAG TPA: lysylphosphatidylglycerol synthase transmembrane domain-containing protein [Vicinamibacterales bacterium]|nr:lysylphosphatidylglycerol synthase transmembrane domain-containing protein [Vicinamibacterales bacterium]
MPEQSPARSSGRRHLLTAAKVVVSLLLLAFLFSRVDAAHLWAGARHASLPWLAAALVLWTLNVAASTWRWHLLLEAQQVRMPRRTLFGSFLVANFFNNFLPSNIGGDVIRIRDTAPAARSTALAATVVLVDRGLGLMGLVLISAMGASLAVGLHGQGVLPIWPSWLWLGFVVSAAVAVPAMYAPEGLGRLLKPLTFLHPEWVESQIRHLTGTLSRFRDKPSSLIGCFGGAVLVQALIVAFYLAVVYALHIPVKAQDLAVIVPLSLIVQMLPVSLNGFGVREATFSFYFTRVGLPIESAVLLSLVAAGITMLHSLSGAAVYVTRKR